MSDTINNDYLHLALKLHDILYRLPDHDEPLHKIVTCTRELILAGRKLHRLAEQDCNRGLNEAEEAQVAAIRVRMNEILKPYDIEPIFSGDPRGCTFKLKMPDGSTNDFGHEGWMVPV